PYDAPLRERFFLLVRNKFHFYLENLDAAQFIEQYSYSPIITNETRELAWQIWQDPIVIMEEGAKQQILQELPTYVLILLSNGAIYSLVREHRNGRILLNDKLIEAAVAACWDSIKR